MFKCKILRFVFLSQVLVLLGCFSLKANDLKLEVQAPKAVYVGEVFRVIFTANKNVENFTPPTFDGFSVLVGPVQSSMSETSFVNGNVSHNVKISYTYNVRAEKEGVATIGAAKVKADGKEAESQPIQVECVKDNDAQRNKQSNQGTTNNTNAQTSSSELFIRTEPSLREVYRGEHVVVTTKLYLRGVNIIGVENFKVPSTNGFWAQDINNIGGNLSFQRENTNSGIYNVAVLNKQLLFAQQTGDITIDPTEIDVIQQVQTQPRNQLEAFFGGSVQNYRVPLKSEPLKIKVKPLPAGAPASFTGGVGNFKIESSISKKTVTANDAVTLVIKITGSGNLKLLNAPKVDFPLDFEVYDTKTTENIKNTETGANGVKQFEIPLIPRSAGEFTIQPVEFSYFNPSTRKYVTLKTKPHTIAVERDPKASTNYVSGGDARREGIKFLGKDIRFIKTGVVGLAPINTETFTGSAWFYLLYFLLILIFLGIFFILRKYIKDNQNVVLVKNKKANKVARKRLSKSALLLKTGNAQGFYDELLRTMWGYLSDKLNIPIAELSRDKAKEVFYERNIEMPYIETFLGVIDECEFARYAPSSGRKEMENVYKDAVSVISKLEQRIK